MKKLLLSAFAVVAAFTASAAATTYNVDNADNIQGTDIAEAMKDDGTVQQARHIQPLISFQLDEYLLSFTNGGGKTDPAYYYATSTSSNQQKTVRLYASNTMTIAAPDGVNMTKIEFKGSNAAKDLVITPSAGTITSVNNAVWEGSANSLTLTYSGTYRFSEITITTGEGGETGGLKTLYSGLLETASETDWTFDDVTLPEGGTYVWSWKTYNSLSYLNASGYINGAKACEAYAISPVIDLTKATKDITVEFEHAAKFQTTLRTLCGFYVREEGATTWTELTIPAWPEAGSWDFAESGSIDLNAYAGKKIQLAFLYRSTTEGADTWEIKNLVITGEGEGQVTPPEQPQPGLVKYEKVSTITSGAKYIFVIDGQYGAAIASTVSYGRLNLTDGTEEGGFYTAPEAAAITITEVAGKGYTLVDSENRYLGMDDSHLTSFQLYTEATDGCYWTAAFSGDQVTFTNALNTTCIICRSTGTTGTPYTNVAPAVIAEGQTLPTLYKMTEGAGVNEIAVDNDAAPVYYNLQGVQVANPANGIYLMRKGNKVTKVLVK